MKVAGVCRQTDRSALSESIQRRGNRLIPTGREDSFIVAWDAEQSAKLVEAVRGKFIVFDGPDGGGKSTQLQKLQTFLESHGVAVCVCRDPGGTEIGDRIRSVLLDYDLSQMNVNCEALLFMASRAQLCAEVIRPAQERGETVLCSRFVSATCAYQGAAGYDPKRVIELAYFAIDGGWPDATVLLDVEVERGFERIGRKPQHAGKHRKKSAGQPTLFGSQESETVTDAMEARPIAFHRRVRKVFLELCEYYPTPIVTVAGDEPEEKVHEAVLKGLFDVLA